MARGIPKNVKEEVLEEPSTAVAVLEENKPVNWDEVPIEEFPLETYSDYKRYNKRAAKLNKELARKNADKEVRYPRKPCPLDLHPSQRIVFNRKDQPRNPLPVFLSTDMIEYKETLVPGKTYDLPIAVLKFLSEKGTPVFEWFDNPDGSRETREVSKDPRFALRSVYED